MIVVIPSYLSQFNYQLLGPESGQKWVFLHGLMGSGANWRKITSQLSTTERILIFDQRGHGRSMKPATGYAPEDFANDLFQITEELGWQKFNLVGHSMGGRNAIVFASKYPEKVIKLVIEDIGPEGDPEAPAYYRRLLGLVPTPFASKLAAKEFFLNDFPSRARAAGYTENIETLGQYFYTNLVEVPIVPSPEGQESAVQVDWRFSAEAIHQSVLLGRAKDIWDEMRRLSMETLIIRGQNSKELSHEVFSRMTYTNPRVRGVEIPNAGHWVHSDQSEMFLAELRKFAGLPL
jgi:pimeloyl-ACP methyl ester carboxylesterase